MMVGLPALWPPIYRSKIAHATSGCLIRSASQDLVMLARNSDGNRYCLGFALG